MLMSLNIEMPKKSLVLHLEEMENYWFLGVPILKHFRVMAMLSFE